MAHRAALLRAWENPATSALPGLLLDPAAEEADVRRFTALWAERDAPGAWKWFEGKDGRRMNYHPGQLSVVMHAWLRKDPSAAREAFLASDIGTRGEVSKEMIDAMLGGNATARTVLAADLEELVAAGDDGTNLPDPFAPPAGGESARLAELLEMPSTPGRSRLLKAAAWSWLMRDWKATAAWTATLSEPLKSEIMIELGPRTFTIGPPSDCGTGGVVSSAEEDPAAYEWARRWFTEEAPLAARREVARWFLPKLAETDSAAAVQWAFDHLSAAPLNEAISALVENLAVKNSAAAREVVDSLPLGPRTKQAAAEAMVTNPDAASVTWVLARGTKPSEEKWMLAGFTWGEKKPADFQTRVVAGDAELLPKALIKGGMDGIMHRDPKAAVAWVAALPDGVVRTAGAAVARENLPRCDFTPAERAALEARLGAP